MESHSRIGILEISRMFTLQAFLCMNGKVSLCGSTMEISGKGAMAGINVSDLGEDVYEVTYQTEKQFSKYLEKVQFIMDEFLALPEAEDEETKKRLFHFVKVSVEQVCYLCKDEYYSYEKEARIVLIRDLEKIKTEDKPRENEVFPRIYVPMEGEMKISSVTLGPLVSSRAAITLALAKRGIPRKPSMNQRSRIIPCKTVHATSEDNASLCRWRIFYYHISALA